MHDDVDRKTSDHLSTVDHHILNFQLITLDHSWQRLAGTPS